MIARFARVSLEAPRRQRLNDRPVLTDFCIDDSQPLRVYSALNEFSVNRGRRIKLTIDSNACATAAQAK